MKLPRRLIYLRQEMISLTDSCDSLSTLALAYIGDCVYELLVRTHFVSEGHNHSLELHRLTVSTVNAVSQAKAAEKIMPLLTDDELSIFKRGRNAKVNSVPKNASVGEYHAATGLETLFGSLYLHGQQKRIDELFALIISDKDD